MIDQQKISRLLRAAVATCAMFPLAGCKHVSTWTNVSPAVSTPDADPFGYPPGNEGSLHRPEVPLSPVPTTLPEPGHSVPIDPPPAPPPPAEAGISAPGDSISEKGRPWALRPMSFMPRKELRSEAVQPAADVADKTASSSVTSRPAARPAALPISKFEPAGASKQARLNSSPYSPGLGSPGVGTLSSSPKTLAAPSASPDFAEEGYTGPKITPGAQYSVGRDVAIESWPYTQRPVTDQSTVKLRKEPQFTADDFVPVAPPQTSTLLPPPGASPAAVPLLLPPGS